jgi:hypothetical protein
MQMYWKIPLPLRDPLNNKVKFIVMKLGRAIPVVWHTDTLKSNQSRYERQTVERLRHALPQNVHITIIADRGFGSAILFNHLTRTSGTEFRGLHRWFSTSSTIVIAGFEGKAI